MLSNNLSTYQKITLYYKDILEWLAWQGSFRTFRWQDIIGDTEILMKECRYLVNLISF
jgi:hypothetical protein